MTEEELKLRELLSARNVLRVEELRIENGIASAMTGVLRQRGCEVRAELNRVNACIDSLVGTPSRRAVVYEDPEHKDQSQGIMAYRGR